MELAINRHKVLVLNKFWNPLKIVSLKRVITLLFSCYKDGEHVGEPKAKIIDPTRDFQTFSWSDWSKIKPIEGENTIRGTNDNFKVPEIILLSSYDKFPRQEVTFSRRAIWKRDGGICQYCGCKSGESWSIDHVLPKSQNGKSIWENVVIACIQCNSQKADRLPENAFKGGAKIWKGPSPMKLLAIPKKPKYSFLNNDHKFYPKSWSNFISEIYWNIELENDN